MTIRHKVNGNSPADDNVTFCHTSAMNFGQRLKAARLAQKPKMSQAALAALLGCDQSTVAKWETEERAPQDFQATLDKIAAALGGQASWYFDGTGEPPPGVNLSESNPNDSATVHEYPIDLSDTQTNGDGRMKLDLWETVKALRKQYGDEFEIVVKATRARQPRAAKASFQKRPRKPTAR